MNISSLARVMKAPQTIPTFEDVCKICVDCNLIMNIELKSTTEEIDAKLLENILPIIEKYDPDFTLSRISSFNKDILWKVQELQPKIPVGALFNCGLHRDETNEKMVRETTPETFLDNLRSGLDSVNLCAETLCK